MLDYNLSQRNKNKNHDELQAIQVSAEHIQDISNNYDGIEIVIKLDKVKFVYKFDYIECERYFTELCLLDGFSRVLAVAYKDDYVIKRGTGVYVLNKEQFEKYYDKFKWLHVQTFVLKQIQGRS
jgi:hypothetical protein